MKNLIVEYTFTGFHSSGNPFLWYYDENQRTMFETSINVQTWDKAPKIGDKVKYEKSGNYHEVKEKVWINDELVFVRSEEKEAERKQMWDDLHNKIRRDK